MFYPYLKDIHRLTRSKPENRKILVLVRKRAARVRLDTAGFDPF